MSTDPNNWQVKDLHEKIIGLYQKRCDIVHRGILKISKDDLQLSDYFLFNILQNVIKHINIFPNQDALTTFSKKVQAENLLGIESSVRPRTLQDIGHSNILARENVPNHIWDIVNHMILKGTKF